MQPYLVTPVTGYELAVVRMNLGNPPNVATYNVSGWEWWMLHFCNTILDNTASAVPARLALQVSQNGITNGLWFSPADTALGESTAHSFTVGAGNLLVSNLNAMIALGEVTMIGDGLVGLSVLTGAGGTAIGVTTIGIIGRRYRGRTK